MLILIPIIVVQYLLIGRDNCNTTMGQTQKPSIGMEEPWIMNEILGGSW